jgi:S1-C subfamily serine protease
MGNTDWKPQKKLNADTQRKLLVYWIAFLSFIVFAIAAIANFSLGTSQFNKEAIDHAPFTMPDQPVTAGNQNAALPTSQLPVPPSGLTDGVTLAIGQALNSITVDIRGSTALNGNPDTVLGSGVVVGEQDILTNYHVVENGTNLTVVTRGSVATAYPAFVTRADGDNDLALLRFAPRSRLPRARLGDSNLVEAGDRVFAVADAPGGNMLMRGVVYDRTQNFSVGGRTYQRLIRAGTYMYPGSGGRPLANALGEVVGINTAIYTPGGVFTGIWLATPINRAKRLLENGPWTGAGGLADIRPLAGQNYNSEYSLAA